MLGKTAVDAWKSGAAKILELGQVRNLFTTIDKPCEIDQEWLVRYSPRSLGSENDNIRDVVDTIFPMDLYSRHSDDRSRFFMSYLACHDRARRWRRNRATWGTYFERLIRFPLAENVNQLDRAIEKLRTWSVRNTTGIVFHLSSPAADAPRTRGGPCWHYGELLWHRDNSIDLVAVYRNHDFFNKALGNFIALGQLLQFICTQANKEPAKLICHSVNAYNSGGVTKLRHLVG